MQRRLAAILAADVVGYSRLMERDEAGTLAALKALRAELIDPAIAEHQGRIVKLMGDGALVEFGSVADALNCARAIQESMVRHNSGSAAEKSISFRIGINLGDVIVEGEDIYGSGVNIAARLEGQAVPGGICISGAAFDSLGNKGDWDFEDLGQLQVKNLEQSVRAFQVAPKGDAAHRQAAGVTQENPPLSEKPSIAVLPFVNMSADPEQAFFADGIAEDVITELSKFRSLFVIARNSSFAFRGQALDVKEISRKLGVRYLVEGSVRSAGRRVRITAQLIDAVQDQHLWAERYDRELEDIFAVQDEVTRAIVSTIEPELASSERQRARRKPTENLDAWECFQRGLWHLYRYSAEDSLKAQSFFRRAMKLDRNFSSAPAALAFALYYHVILGYTRDREGDLEDALAVGQRAVALDANDPFAQVALGRVHTVRGEHDSAVAACDRGIALNPNFASAHFGRAHSLWQAGRPEEAIPSHDMAMRLSPRDPLLWAYLASKAIALILLGRYEEALDCGRKARQLTDRAIWALLPEVSALGALGRIEEAKAALARAQALKPGLTCNFIPEALAFSHAEDRDHFQRGLIAAGLPE
jgi:adenylate cyclase